MDKGAQVYADRPEVVHVLGHIKARRQPRDTRAAEQLSGCGRNPFREPQHIARCNRSHTKVMLMRNLMGGCTWVAMESVGP